ncbi:piggyBac transposable element-derived protein 4-like [Diorhabda sublineata]|uniref:piggyBac transposable element-derived protein 4-like n=1 Tax=Diorhabda sublineata TaxID=1163346 RepID=UPI0024E11E40|nr:piggyBac transposable element-derived protein 4-like [Diorhabda sublineata]
MFFGADYLDWSRKKPKLHDYRSNNLCYKNGITTQNYNKEDKLYKVSAFIELMNTNFQKWCVPEENVCIDESMIPFRGRLGFRQYIPNKRHRYGLKVYKLCADGDYTYTLKLYGGKSTRPGTTSVATDVVMELMASLLNSGRTLVTDNFYTSVSLANKLNTASTHLIGTLRPKRKFNPTPVVSVRLTRGEMTALQSNTNVIVGKWRDKRDILFLTTKDVPKMQDIVTRRGTVKKPSTILEYNKSKSFIDTSDQKAAYASTIQKGIKWYRKIIFELLTNTGVVNAYLLFIQVTREKMSITQFREELVLALTKLDDRTS